MATGKNKLTITIEALAEDETPEHSEMVTKSASGYAKAVREVMKTAEGRWGWCCVKITVLGGKREGTSYLGNCSYKNAQDFIKNSGYLQQMVDEAVAEATEETGEHPIHWREHPRKKITTPEEIEQEANELMTILLEPKKGIGSVGRAFQQFLNRFKKVSKEVQTAVNLKLVENGRPPLVAYTEMSQWPEDWKREHLH